MKCFVWLVLLSIFTSLPVQSETTVSLYTWRAQEKVLWDVISEGNMIPGVKIDVRVVRYQTHESYQPHITIEILHDNADLFQWSPGAAKLKPLIDKNLIKPNQADVSDINKAALLASLGPDGKYYGVPFALQLESLLINKKKAEKLGVYSQPKNLNELAQKFATIKAAGVTPLHIAGEANWLIKQVIGEVLVAGLVDAEYTQRLINGKACFNSEEFTEIFRVLSEWRDAGYVNTNWETEGYTGMNSSVAMGNSVASFDGGWKTGPASNFWDVDPNFEFGFWSVPGKSNKVYALGDGSYQVNHTSSRAVAAYKVLQFTATQEFAELFAEHVKELPAYGGPISISNPLLRNMSKQLAENSYTVSLFTADSVNKKEPSYNSLIVDAFKSVMKGDSTPEQAGEYIQKGLNGWRYIGAKRCKI